MTRYLSVKILNTFKARFWGLKDSSLCFKCLYFPRCKAVHTFGMKIPIDLIWLNSQQTVIRLDETVLPNRIKMCWKAYGVIEKPSVFPTATFFVGQSLKLKGQALLETSLILPVLFVLLFGFIELSLVMQAQQKLTHAAHWSTQVGAFTNNDEKITGALLEFYQADEIEVALKNKAHTSGDSVLSSERRHQDQLTVELLYPYELNLPFISVAPFDLKATATARVLCQKNVAPYQCD